MTGTSPTIAACISIAGPSGRVGVRILGPARYRSSGRGGRSRRRTGPGGAERGRSAYAPVESTDRQVVVEWTDCPSLNFRLDRAATLPTLATARQFGELELGWGPARARERDFAKAFTPPIRRLIGELMKIPGVTQIDLDSDRPRSVTVRDRAGMGHPVFSGSAYDTGLQYRAYAALADVTGVTAVQVGTESANLNVAHDITDGDLVTAFKAVTELSSTHRIDLYVNHDPDKFEVAVLGRVVNRKYIAPSPAVTPGPTPPDVDPALIARVAEAWTRVAPA